MINNESFMLVWWVFTGALKGAGVLACVLSISSVFLSKLKSKYCISPTPIALKVLYIFSSRSVVCILLISFAFLIASLFVEIFEGDTNGFYIFLFSIISGVCLHLSIGQKGLGLPLGYGLTMTLEKTPNLGIRLSKYALCFHVDKSIIKKRRKVTELIISTVNDSKASGNDLDFILKSWLFVEHSGPTTKKIKQVRACMNGIRLTLVFYAVFAVASIIHHNCNNTGRALLNYSQLMLGSAMAVIIVGCLLFRASALAKAICNDPSRNKISETMLMLANEIGSKAVGYRVEHIGVRPISKAHIFGLSNIRKVTEVCIGAEAGFALVHLKVAPEF